MMRKSENTRARRAPIIGAGARRRPGVFDECVWAIMVNNVSVGQRLFATMGAELQDCVKQRISLRNLKSSEIQIE